MTGRANLHLSKLEEFAEWATKNYGYKIEEKKGYYEILRMRNKKYIFIAYEKLYAKEHATTFGRGVFLVKKFLKEHK